MDSPLHRLVAVETAAMRLEEGGAGFGEGKGVDSFNDVYESNDVHAAKYAHQEDVGLFT